MSKQTLTFLGRDAGFGNQNNSAYVELNNSRFLLIDCGYTVFNKLKDNFDLLSHYDNVQVVITHLHNDHAGTISHLAACLYFKYNKKITIISKCKHLEELMTITGTPKEAYEIVDHVDDLNLKLIETKHTDYLDAYGFKATINGRNIVYTGDTYTLEPFIPYLEDCDEFYMDTSLNGECHVNIEKALPLLRDLKNKGTDVFLMHLQNKEKIEEITNKEFYTE